MRIYLLITIITRVRWSTIQNKFGLLNTVRKFITQFKAFRTLILIRTKRFFCSRWFSTGHSPCNGLSFYEKYHLLYNMSIFLSCSYCDIHRHLVFPLLYSDNYSSSKIVSLILVFPNGFQNYNCLKKTKWGSNYKSKSVIFRQSNFLRL